MKRGEEITPQRALGEILEVLRVQCPRITRDSWQPLGAPLKQCLQSMGTKAGLRAYASHPTGEYLWDVSWTYESNDEYWVDMAAEIELSDMTRTCVLDDFYKVLDAKARLKVFITAVTQKMAKNLRADVVWAVKHQRFRFRGERLIAVLVTYDGRKRAYNAAVRVFNGSGPIGAWSKRWKIEDLGSAE